MSDITLVLQDKQLAVSVVGQQGPAGPPVPAGTNTRVLFSDGSAVDTDADFTYDKATNALTLNGRASAAGITTTGSVILGSNGYVRGSTALGGTIINNDADTLNVAKFNNDQTTHFWGHVSPSSFTATADLGTSVNTWRNGYFGTTLFIGTADNTEWDGVGARLALGGVNPAMKFHAAAAGVPVMLNYLSDSLKQLRWYNSTANKQLMALTEGGNLALGLDPYAWSALYRAIDLESYGAIYSTTGSGSSGIANNAYVHATGGWRKKWGGFSSLYQQDTNDGVHRWFTAASGIADSTASWVQVMVVDAVGNLGVSTTPSAWHANAKAAQFPSGALWAFGTSQLNLSQNSYYDGAAFRALTTGPATGYHQADGIHYWYSTGSVVAGAVQTLTEHVRLDSNGLKTRVGLFPYNIDTDASNYERGGLTWLGNTLYLLTQAAGTGVIRPIHITGSEVELYAGGVSANGWKVDVSGHLIPKTAGGKNIGDITNYVGLLWAEGVQVKGANAGLNVYRRDAGAGGWTIYSPTGDLHFYGPGGGDKAVLNNAGDLTLGRGVITGVATVATLPAAASSTYMRLMVSDSSVAAAGNFGAVVASGGTNKVPVYSDGTNWRIG